MQYTNSISKPKSALVALLGILVCLASLNIEAGSVQIEYYAAATEKSEPESKPAVRRPASKPAVRKPAKRPVNKRKTDNRRTESRDKVKSPAANNNRSRSVRKPDTRRNQSDSNRNTNKSRNSDSRNSRSNNDRNSSDLRNNLFERPAERTYESRPLIRVNLDQAVSNVRRNTDGKVIKAYTRNVNGRPVHYVRVLSDKNRVRTYRIDAVNGRLL